MVPGAVGGRGPSRRLCLCETAVLQSVTALHHGSLDLPRPSFPTFRTEEVGTGNTVANEHAASAAVLVTALGALFAVVDTLAVLVEDDRPPAPPPRPVARRVQRRGGRSYYRSGEERVRRVLGGIRRWGAGQFLLRLLGL